MLRIPSLSKTDIISYSFCDVTFKGELLTVTFRYPLKGNYNSLLLSLGFKLLYELL